jgi:hypothetical protein
LGYGSWTSLVSQHNFTSTKDLLSIDIGQSDKGTRPPISLGRQRVFLEQLYRAINENYDHDAPEYHPVDLPEEYGLLLSITDGLHDTDLRGSGVCGIDGIRDADPVKMTGNSNLRGIPWASVLWKSGWNNQDWLLFGSRRSF